MNDSAEYDQLAIPRAKSVMIQRGPEHVVTVDVLLQNGESVQAQVMSYGEPLGIFAAGGKA